MNKKYEIYPVDNAIKSYLLGFLACDSSLYSGDKIQLELKDECIIKLFKEIMGCNYVKYDKYDKRTDKTYTGYRLYKCIDNIINIYNGRIKNERKIPYDIVPKEYISFLIQGVFDADGTVRAIPITEHSIRTSASIASSENIILDCYSIIKENLGIDGKLYYKDKYVEYYIYNKYDFFRFFYWIYNPLFLPLRRKYEKAIYAINYMINYENPEYIPQSVNYFLGKNIYPYLIKPFYIDSRI